MNEITETPTGKPCGVPTLEFLYADDSALDTFLFNKVLMSTDSYELSIFTDSLDAVKEHRIKYRFYYSENPSHFVESNVLVVDITNPCVPGGTVTEAQTIVPTDQVFQYTPGVDPEIFAVRQFTTTPNEMCGQQIEYSTNTVDMPGITVDGFFFKLDPIEIMKLVANMPTVQIPFAFFGQIGFEMVEASNAMLIINNPCFNPGLVSITPATLPSVDYEMYQTKTWFHDEFTVNSSEELGELCGSLGYTVTAGDLSDDISFAEPLKIEFTSESLELLAENSWEYTVTAFFEDHSNLKESATGTINVLNPCDNAVVTAAQTTVSVIGYMGTKETHSFPALVVTPLQSCAKQVTYTCSYDSGPHSTFNLCDFNLGSGTLFKFDAATGSMEINVNVLEKQTFAHGDYFFTLKASMLGQEVTVQFEYRLQDPCNRGQL